MIKRKANKSRNIVKGKMKRTFMIITITVFVIFIAGLSASGGYFFVKTSLLKIKHFQVEGNKILNDRNVISLMGARNKNLFLLDLNETAEKLTRSQWIRNVQLRKEYPDTLLVRVMETEPVALLREGNSIYLIGDKGLKLKKLNKAIPLFPIIKVKRKNKEAYDAAVELANTIRKNQIMMGKPIEINGTKPENISIRFNSNLILIGFGGYGKKLQKYLVLRDEIKKKNIQVEYIDMRFSNRLIVKPLKRDIK